MNDIYKEATEQFGKEAQVFVAIEELSELITELVNCLSFVKGKFGMYDVDIRKDSGDIKAICKEVRHDKKYQKYIVQPINKKEIIDEIADVTIMLEQIRIIFNISEEQILERINIKLERLKERITNHKEQKKNGTTDTS